MKKYLLSAANYCFNGYCKCTMAEFKIPVSPTTHLVFMKCRFQTKTQHGLFVMMEWAGLLSGKPILDFTRTTDGGNYLDTRQDG